MYFVSYELTASESITKIVTIKYSKAPLGSDATNEPSLRTYNPQSGVFRMQGAPNWVFVNFDNVKLIMAWVSHKAIRAISVRFLQNEYGIRNVVSTFRLISIVSKVFPITLWIEVLFISLKSRTVFCMYVYCMYACVYVCRHIECIVLCAEFSHTFVFVRIQHRIAKMFDIFANMLFKSQTFGNCPAYFAFKIYKTWTKCWIMNSHMKRFGVCTFYKLLIVGTHFK